MAFKTWEVEVFNVTEEIVCNPKYNKKVKLRADYDPQGISIKLIDGMYSISQNFFYSIMQVSLLVFFYCC